MLGLAKESADKIMIIATILVVMTELLITFLNNFSGRTARIRRYLADGGIGRESFGQGGKSVFHLTAGLFLAGQIDEKPFAGKNAPAYLFQPGKDIFLLLFEVIAQILDEAEEGKSAGQFRKEGRLIEIRGRP